MTQLAQALRAAGIMPPVERLHTIAVDTLRQFPKDWTSTETTQSREFLPPALKEIAVSALAKNPRNWDGAKDAVYQAVRNDAALMWLLFEPYRALAVQKLLSDVAAELRAATQAQGGGHLPRDHQSTTAPAGRESVERKPNAPARSGMEAASNVARLSLLDTFKINNRPIGDCTSEEANRWAGSRERDARFVRLLTANLPQDQPIRKYRRAEDTQALYDEAQEMTDVG